MYRCSIYGTDKINQYEELIKVFLQPGEYEISGTAEIPGDLSAKTSADVSAKGTADDVHTVCVFDGDKDAVKRQI